MVDGAGKGRDDAQPQIRGERKPDVVDDRRGKGRAGSRSEGRGAGEFFLTHADQELIIPMNPRCESLNAAIAAAIVMWEMKSN